MAEHIQTQSDSKFSFRKIIAKIGQIPELRISLLVIFAVILLTFGTENFSNPNNIKAMAAGMATD